METKTLSAIETKVLDEAQGIVETIWTLFGVIDQGKDVAHPGMFTKTFTERGQKVKVLDMHQRDSIMRALGKTVELRELSRGELPPRVVEQHPQATGGAYARIQFLMDTPEGKGAFIRLREGVVDEWSYGYDALDYDHETIKGTDGQDVTVRNLRTVKLYELGPVLWGMVPGTQTVSAKSEPSEGKPVETTENYVRVRVRAPGLFEEGSFRTITISADEGIRAVIGRLKGETTTTIQTYLFDKDKWDEERAKKWVKEHKKDWEGMVEAKADAPMKTEADGKHPASHYLVVEDPKEVSTWHLRVRDVGGKPDHRLMGAAWAALHGGYRGNRYEGPNQAEAIAKLKRLYQQEDLELPSKSDVQIQELFERVAELEGKGISAPDGGPRFNTSEQLDVTAEAGPETPTSKEQRMQALRHIVEIALLEVQDADKFGQTG